MNIKLLNDKIEESGIKKVTIAKAMKCTYMTLQSRLDGKSGWSLDEIIAVNDVLHLTKKERDMIFFGK